MKYMYVGAGIMLLRVPPTQAATTRRLNNTDALKFVTQSSFEIRDSADHGIINLICDQNNHEDFRWPCI